VGDVGIRVAPLLLGYNFTPRIGVQLNVPIIARTFRRLESGQIQHGNETGFGDLSLLALARPYSRINDESVVRVSMFGGLKLPSGSPDRLGEESEEDHGGAREDAGALLMDHDTSVARHVHGGPDHEGEMSGIHGHDLALGSGSVDGVIGASVYGSWRRVFFVTSVQYLMRTQGSFDYRYANDVTWRGGPGVYLLLGHGLFGRDYSLAAQVLTSGEHKGDDELDGNDQSDTAITAVYLGPALSVTWGTALAAEFEAEGAGHARAATWRAPSTPRPGAGYRGTSSKPACTKW